MLSAAKAKAVENEKGYVNLFLSAKRPYFSQKTLIQRGY